MSTLRLAPLFVACVVLASCGGGTLQNEAAFRVIHVSPDSPVLNVLVDGVGLSALNYSSGTQFYFVTPRNYDFSFQAVLPGDDTVAVDKPGTPILAGTEYTLLAIGKAATPVPQPGSLQGLLIQNPIEDIPADKARLQLVHAAPDAPPMLDVYLTAKDPLTGYADLVTETPIDQITYGDVPADRIQVVAGIDYVIRITEAGVKAPVLFDSGEFLATNQLRSRADFLLVVVANTAAGDKPISLVINDRRSNALVLDKDATSDLRVVHVSPDAPALDVKGVGTQVVPLVCTPQVSPCPAVDPPPVLFASGLTYLGNTSYVGTLQDTYNLSGVLTSDPNPTTALFTVSRFFAIGQRATLLAIGLLR